MQFSSGSCCFHHLQCKHSQHLVFRHPQSMFFPYCENQVLHPYKKHYSSLLSLVYGLDIQGSIPIMGNRIFFSPWCQDLLWAHQTSIQWVQRSSLPRINVTNHLCLVLSSRKVKLYYNAWCLIN